MLATWLLKHSTALKNNPRLIASTPPTRTWSNCSPIAPYPIDPNKPPPILFFAEVHVRGKAPSRGGGVNFPRNNFENQTYGHHTGAPSLGQAASLENI